MNFTLAQTIKSNKILPVPAGVKRPLWSVMIPTYNPGKYITEAINSVIIQDPGPEIMQIEVVDDCSGKVDVEKIVNDNWKGRVGYYRLPKNVGHSFNFTESVRRAKGELIHLLHDDDRVKPGFYNTFENIFKQYKDIGAAFCRQAYIDEEGNLKFYSDAEMEHTGILDDALIKLAQKQRIQYCAMVVRRKVFEYLGGFVPKNIGCEDWEMWVRIAKDYPIAYEPQALAEYRVHHGTSMTLKDMRSGQDMRYMREAISIFNEYVPKEKRAEVNLYRRKYYGDYSFRNAKRLLDEFKDEEGAAAQLSETIKIDPELLFSKKDFLLGLESPVEGAGISVIINAQNDEELIERTLRHLIIQSVPKYIPWEIIIADNSSTDGTVKVAAETWEKYNGKTPFKIIQLESTGIFEAKSKAIQEAKYNFVLFCNPGNLLSRNYVKMASVNLMRDRELGAVSGFTESFMKTEPPSWYEDWSNLCYQVGEQFEYTSFVTWSRGYVWGSGMAMRKEAWKDLLRKEFQSAFKLNRDKISEIGIDTELCYAMRLSGWNIWYSTDLRLKQYISESKLEWKRLRKIWRQFGINSVALKPYIEFQEHSIDDYKNIPNKKNNRKLITKAYRRLSKFTNWKLRDFSETLEGDPEILMIEHKIARLKELLKGLKNYNQRVRILRRIARKKDFNFLKYAFVKPYFRFPEYKKTNDRRGVSVILGYNNTSYHYLLKSLEKISLQKLPENFPWEVILVSNFIKDEVKKKIYMQWERSNCSASLKIKEESFLNQEIIREIAIEKSKFDNLIFLDEFDLINPDYVRIAYKSIRKNKTAGIIGGQTEPECDVNPPKWFGNHKELFGIGQPAQESGDITFNGKYIWRSGVIVRKQALREIKKTDYAYETRKSNEPNEELPYDTDLENKIKLTGWKIFYEERLKLKKIIPVKKFNWEYIRKLNYYKGVYEVKENAYTELLSLHSTEKNGNGKNKSWLYSANKTLGELKKYPLKKIFSKESEYSGDIEILEIEKLQGRFKELIRNKYKYPIPAIGTDNYAFDENKIRNGFEATSKRTKGVSIIICCYNSSKVLPSTLKYIITQEVPDDIPWEVIVVDNASTDNTSKIAQDYWESHNCLAHFQIVREAEPGLSAARLKGFNTAKYEFMVLCDDDNHLAKDFVKSVYEIMNEQNNIGVLGGQSKAEFEKLRPKWFNDWKGSFAIGKQWNETGDITNEKGYVWGAAMVVRKEALDKLLSKGFRSLLTDRKGNALSSGGDTEICYALRNEGWKIWYDSRLKFKHYITEERLEWNYLKKLFRGFGRASSGLDHYIKKYSRHSQKKSVSNSIRTELHKVITTLRNKRYQKLTSDKKFEGDPDIPMIEYTLGRLESLLKLKKSYNRGLKLLKNTARKRDLKNLVPYFRNNKNKFPGYNTEKKLNGVSIVICTYNGEERLPETIKYIAKQNVDPKILWEVILVDNASTDNTKQAVINEWKKHKTKAKLIITDEITPGLTAARQKGFDTSNYEYIVLCDDDNLLEENFVQTTYDIMSSNEKIGVLGGPNEAVCEIEPPEWFKWFQHGYAAGTQADLQTGRISEGNITWKRGFVWGAGMIIRKKAMNELYDKGFKSLMSDRKGNQLSSGGDSELCFALVLSGWEVWYDTRLKLKHCMTAGRLEWQYLIRLFQGFGITSVGLDLYEKAIRLGRADTDAKEINKQNWKYEYKKTYKDLEEYGIKKILSLRFPQNDNTKIPMLEYYIARLKELRRVKKEYDKNFEAIKNAAWKKNNSELKASHRRFIERENNFQYGWPWDGAPVISQTDKTYPKISILSPSFNSVNTIEKAILSVLNQGYPNFEHIICDGGSTDGTVEILKKYPHLKWVSEKDSGQCDAMNKAFEMSTGDIIAYLNVDDYFQRGVFGKIAKAFEENPDAEMVVGNLFFEDGEHTFIRRPEIDYKKIMQPFRYIFPINPVSYFYKRNVQIKTGPFPLDNHYTMDYWFLLKAYQKHKIIKIEDYLGTFCMNGFNKTSGADNRKNTHYRVLEHCWKEDRKNLPFYLYNYYKFYYYEKKPYNLRKLYNKARKNLGRIYSILTFRKNKYHSEKFYESARAHYYLNKRYKGLTRLAASFAIYPKGLKQRSRQSMLVYLLLGLEKTEKAKKAYFFFTTPPGLPLSNKLYYFGNEFKQNNKPVKGNTLLILTYLISPKFIFKKDKYSQDEKLTIGKFIYYLNPLNWIKGIYRFFKYKKYRESSYNLYEKAGSKYFFHKNLQATLMMISSFLLHPATLKKKSRLNLFLYSVSGNLIADQIKFIYHLYKDNPEYTFAHKLNYYGNQLRQERHSFKGNTVLLFTYLVAPKYIFKREKIKKSNIVFASEFTIPKKKLTLNPVNLGSGLVRSVRNYRNSRESLGTRLKNSYLLSKYKLKLSYHYFRYRKYKAQSKELYSKAQENFNRNKRLRTISQLTFSYILYPKSLSNRNKLSLMINSVLGRSVKSRTKGDQLKR